jgi:hypothetical protein
MTLVSVTAYHSFGGEVEASNTPTIRRLTPSCRHQLPRIALDDEGATEQAICKYGGAFVMQLPNYPGVDAEKKFKDINGVVFDVSEHGWG